jgi:hypothetical protein
MQYFVPGILVILVAIFWGFIGLLSLSGKMRAGADAFLISFASIFTLIFLAEALFLWSDIHPQRYCKR